MTAVLIHVAGGLVAFGAGFLIGRLVGWADGFSAGYQEGARQFVDVVRSNVRRAWAGM